MVQNYKNICHIVICSHTTISYDTLYVAVTREGVVLPGAMARLMTNKVLGTWHDRVFIFGFHHSNSLMIDDGRWV